MTTLKTLTALALASALSFPGLARAQFDFITIDVPGATATAADGNSTHEIAGEYDDANGDMHGFVLSNGSFTTINFPGADSTSVNGIAANGRLAGTYFTTRSYAFFWSKGAFMTLDPPGALRSQGGFLNAQGDVVGTYRDSGNVRHCFIWSKGNFTTVDVPGSDPSNGPTCFGIDDRGQVAGTYLDAGGNRHGFLLSDGVYTTIDYPGAVFTVAEGVNNSGNRRGALLGYRRHDARFRAQGRRLYGRGCPRLDVHRNLFDQRDR